MTVFGGGYKQSAQKKALEIFQRSFGVKKSENGEVIKWTKTPETADKFEQVVRKKEGGSSKPRGRMC